MTLSLAVNLCGLLLLVAGAFAPVLLRRVQVGARPALWQGLWRVRWQLGILLGVLSLLSRWVTYPSGARGFVRGIPFAVWGGPYGVPEDLPSPLSVIPMQLNFLFWLLLPQFVLWVTSGRRRVGEAGGPGGHRPE